MLLELEIHHLLKSAGVNSFTAQVDSTMWPSITLAMVCAIAIVGLLSSSSLQRKPFYSWSGFSLSVICRHMCFVWRFPLGFYLLSSPSATSITAKCTQYSWLAGVTIHTVTVLSITRSQMSLSVYIFSMPSLLMPSLLMPSPLMASHLFFLQLFSVINLHAHTRTWLMIAGRVNHSSSHNGNASSMKNM